MPLTAYAAECIFQWVWIVELAPEFEPELAAMAAEVRRELLAQARVIERFGPQTSRPRVDTLNGSKDANMKELRFDAAGGVWRVAFAFDPDRKAMLLVAGDKSGRSEKAFYRRLIAKADERFDSHLVQLKRSKKRKARKRAVGRRKQRKGERGYAPNAR